MHTTKLVLILMTGLAIIEFFIVQSPSVAAATMVLQPLQVSAQLGASPALPVSQSVKSMKGVAAVYSDKLNGRKTASGQTFSQSQLTAAHRSLPLGTKVIVTNIRNSKSVEVRINDRGPVHRSRVIDLSTAAAAEVGMRKTGTALVKLEVVSELSAKKS